MAGSGDIFVFDAYGTLFDVHSAARASVAVLGELWPRVSDIWRAKQLEYAWIHAGLSLSIPFREATRQGLVYALKVCGLDEGLAPRVLAGYQALETFAEVPDVLRRLKCDGAKLAILSNGDPGMLEDLVGNAHLRDVFDALISVTGGGTMKPNPKVYALACDVFKVQPGEIVFLSSNRWDIAGACAFGFRPVWVNRSGAPDEYPHLPPERVIASLQGLLDQNLSA